MLDTPNGDGLIMKPEQNGALSSPIEVVYSEWFRKGNEPHKQTPDAGPAIGLSKHKHRQLELAYRGSPDADPALRRRMLDAVGLEP